LSRAAPDGFNGDGDSGDSSGDSLGGTRSGRTHV